MLVNKVVFLWLTKGKYNNPEIGAFFFLALPPQ